MAAATINPRLSDLLQSSDYALKPFDYYWRGLCARNHAVIAEIITMLESDASSMQSMAMELLAKAQTRKPPQYARRLGVTGAPGAGKSSFIESFVPLLATPTQAVAILSFDPTSIDGRGSILGDKTRMQHLCQLPNVLVRPSASRNHLGGTHLLATEVLSLLDAAGFDWVIIETVGVGQSEVEIAALVDMICLVAQPGAGDELQWIKKGIAEVIDLVIINKADGPQLPLAREMLSQFSASVSMHSVSRQHAQALLYSSIERRGQNEVKDAVEEFFEKQSLASNRQRQYRQWLTQRMIHHTQQLAKNLLLRHPKYENYQKLNSTVLPIEALYEFQARVGISLDIKNS